MAPQAHTIPAFENSIMSNSAPMSVLLVGQAVCGVALHLQNLCKRDGMAPSKATALGHLCALPNTV
jgi:hypothetical protein